MISKRLSLDQGHLMSAIQKFNRECAEEKGKKQQFIQQKLIKHIQNYEIDIGAQIGSGTFSRVYKGKNSTKSRDAIVAVKIVQLKKIEEMRIHQLFWQQLKIVRRLRHSNVVTCFQYFKTVNNCYSIYQYCQQGDLSNLLKMGPLSQKDQLTKANRIIRDVYRGLLYLQSMNIVHRDIKAANILLSRGRAKIGDFGFATKCDKQFKDASIGSPAYMAPEALCHNIYGPKTDVWGFGMLLYEMMHGESPFADCTSEQQLKKKVKTPINWDQLKANLPSPLKRLMLKCLQVDFDQRPLFSELASDQYIQKVQTDQDKPITKSNYTNETDESEKLSFRREIGIKTPISKKQISQKQTNFFGSANQNKSVPSFFQKTFSPKKEEIKISELQIQNQQPQIDNTLLTHQESQMEIVIQNQEGFGLHKQYQAVAFRFIPLKEYEHQIELSEWFETVTILHETIKNMQESSLFSQLTAVPKQFVRHIALELLQIARFHNFLLLTDKVLNLLNQSSVFQEINGPCDPQTFDLGQILETMFNSIKWAQQIIDKYEIDSSQNSNKSLGRSEAFTCVNALILSYRLVDSLYKLKPRQKWLEIYRQRKMESSQWFFIMLYQLQLQKMQESSSM